MTTMATPMTNEQKRWVGIGLVGLVTWEMLSSLALVYALPAIKQSGKALHYGWLSWFGHFTVPPHPLYGILQYLAPILHGSLPTATTWRAIELSAALGALGIFVLYLLWLRLTWAGRFRRRGIGSR